MYLKSFINTYTKNVVRQSALQSITKKTGLQLDFWLKYIASYMNFKNIHRKFVCTYMLAVLCSLSCYGFAQIFLHTYEYSLHLICCMPVVVSVESVDLSINLTKLVSLLL